MVAFATTEDVRDRWANAPDNDRLIGAKLEDAEVWLRSWFPGLPGEPTGDLAAALKMVSSSMVKRSLSAADVEQFESFTDGAGPFSRSRKFRNPDGDLFLTKQEQTMLQRALNAALGVSTGFRSVEARF